MENKINIFEKANDAKRTVGNNLTQATQAADKKLSQSNTYQASKRWISENPYKAAGMGVLALFSLRNRAARSMMLWTATTVGSMFLKQKVKEEVSESL